MSKVPDSSHAAPLAEFLNTLPSPLTITLVGLAPAIAKTRRVVQILAWKTSWEDSWLFLASWWALCLVPEFGLRYVLPLAVFLLFFRMRANSKTQQVPPPVTEDTLQRAIADLTTIHTLLPSLPVCSQFAEIPPPGALFRAIVVLYVPYLALTHLVRLRILLGVAGTLLFTWRSRWAAVLRAALWRSAHLRWAVYRSWSIMSGQPLPTIALSPQSKSDAQLASVSTTKTGTGKEAGTGVEVLPSTSLRFLFTSYENQRWWMGLDWTAALLPGERPSWCSVSQQPVAPPSAFALPSPTTSYTPAPDGKQRVKRTARWNWEEPEWRVVIRRDGMMAASRVERPVPSAREESAAAASASRILKAAGKMRAQSLDLGERRGEKDKEREKEKEGGKVEDDVGEQNGGNGNGNGAGGTVDGEDGEEEQEEPLTDPDGWVYADNKWEGASSKGGMGKYTRFRRWTRVAILTETIEIVEPGELGIRRDEPVSEMQASESAPLALGTQSSTAADIAQSASAPSISSHSKEGDSTSGSARPTPVPVPVPSSAPAPVSVEEDGSSRLRQRLKAAVMGASGHS